MLTDGQDIINQLIIAVHTSRETVEVRVFDNTQILVISQRKERRTFLRTVADGKIVLLNNTSTSDLVKPVCVRHRHCIL